MKFKLNDILAALLFIGNHCKLIAKYVCLEIERLHGIILKYFKLGHEEQKAAFAAIKGFYKVVAHFCELDKNQKQVAEVFSLFPQMYSLNFDVFFVGV